MAEAFSITTASGTVELDASRQGNATFSVSNVSGVPIRARAGVVAQAVVPEPAGAGTRAPVSPPAPEPAAGWFAIEGAAERSFPAGGTEVYRVDVTVPGAAAPPPAGSPRTYRFRLDVLGTDNPDEQQAQGQWVEFSVRPQPAPQRRLPWLWIVVAAAAVVVIAAVAVTAFVLTHRQGTLSETPATVSFGTVAVAASGTQAVTVKNTGPVGTTVNATISGTDAADFAVTPATCLGQTLKSNATCVFDVTFTPAGKGSFVGSLRITGDHAAAQTIPLTGTGGGPMATAQPSPAPWVPVKRADTTYLQATTTITNSGDTPLHVTNVAVSVSPLFGTPMVTNGCAQPVAPNQKCTITVLVLDVSSINPQGTIVITSDAPGSPLTVRFG